jgi:hypothetical protein
LSCGVGPLVAKQGALKRQPTSRFPPPRARTTCSTHSRRQATIAVAARSDRVGAHGRRPHEAVQEKSKKVRRIRRPGRSAVPSRGTHVVNPRSAPKHAGHRRARAKRGLEVANASAAGGFARRRAVAPGLGGWCGHCPFAPEWMAGIAVRQLTCRRRVPSSADAVISRL